MAGVIDEKGQWEHCNCCGKMVLIQHLGYDPPSRKYKHGRDMCLKCVQTAPQAVIRRVIPATSWKQVRV